jgi:RNA polymerase sigma-70 factor (ECF subfamily)
MMSADAIGLSSAERRRAALRTVTPPSGSGASVDAEAEFTAFFRVEFARVLRTVRLVVGDSGRAEEITQDAFVQLLDHWPKVSGYERPDAWVRRVAIRMAGRAARRERMVRLLESTFGTAEPTSELPEGDSDVVAAVRQLPPGQRTAVVLFYFEDRPVVEVAELLGCSPATARVHLHRARRRLAALLGEVVDDVV